MLFRNTLLLAATSLVFSLQAKDWADYDVPADPGFGNTWELIDAFSDDFNYQGKNQQFSEKWNDHYHNAWTGPGLTIWSSDHSDVVDGKLVIKAARKPDTDKVHLGVVTSKTPIIYPVYMEAKIKVANQVLSSNFWLLSADDKRELDILEIYGSDRANHHKHSRHANTNYHVFIRDEESNEIIRDIGSQQHHFLPNEAPYRDNFHRFGAYWIDPWNVEFYIDGRLVRRLNKTSLKDPENLGLDREMFMIIDMEDHDWRSSVGHIASDEDLADETRNKMLVDWVRVYVPVKADANQQELGPLKLPTDAAGLSLRHSTKCFEIRNPRSEKGARYRQSYCSHRGQQQKFTFTEQVSEQGQQVSIKNTANDFCVAAREGKQDLRQQPCDEQSAAQSWLLSNKGHNWFSIKNLATGECLEMAKGSKKNGKNLSLGECDGSEHQSFKFVN